LYGECVSTAVLDLLYNSVSSCFAAAVVDDDRGSSRGQVFGDRGSDAFGGTRDDCHFSIQVAHVFLRKLTGLPTEFSDEITGMKIQSESQ
jgi:hypothetical protein